MTAPESVGGTTLAEDIHLFIVHYNRAREIL